MCRPDYTLEAEMVERLRNNGKRVYIAGPITGVEGYRDNFRRVARLVEAQGFEAVDPTSPADPDGATYRYYINRGLRLIEECDFICMLPGSDKSPGAQLELHYAVLCGMPVMSVSDDYKRILGAELVSSYEAR